jgi:hypothetical protein
VVARSTSVRERGPSDFSMTSRLAGGHGESHRVQAAADYGRIWRLIIQELMLDELPGPDRVSEEKWPRGGQDSGGLSRTDAF